MSVTLAPLAHLPLSQGISPGSSADHWSVNIMAKNVAQFDVGAPVLIKGEKGRTSEAVLFFERAE
jgi:hypothetical protein